MIVGLTLTILGQTSNANRILDEFVAAEASHPKQSIEIRTSSTLTGHEVKITYDLSFLRPNRLRLEIKQPSSDRIFAIEGNRFTAYDPASNQFLTRNLAARGSLAERLSQAVGEVDEPLRI